MNRQVLILRERVEEQLRSFNLHKLSLRLFTRYDYASKTRSCCTRG